METRHLDACPAASTAGSEGCSCDQEPKRYLTLAMWSVGLFAFELIGGILSGSLALISDALHVATDGLENFLSAIVSVAARRSNEVLVRKVGGVISAGLLLFASSWIISEGVERVIFPRQVQGYMLVVAGLGLVVNLLQRKIHHNAPHEHHNITHFWQDMHLLSDISASVAVVIGGVIMYVLGSWYWVDGLLSVAIGSLIASITISRMIGLLKPNRLA